MSVRVSCWDRTQKIPRQQFNDKRSIKRPTHLKFWLSGPDDAGSKDEEGIGECPYCYELEVAGLDERVVVYEALFYWPSSSGRKTRVFERYEDGTAMPGKGFGYGNYTVELEGIMAPYDSIISTLAVLEHRGFKNFSMSEYAARSNILVEKVEASDEFIFQMYIDNPNLVKGINREIKRIDFGIRSIEVRRDNDEPQVYFRHRGFSEQIPIFLESHGLRQFLRLYAIVSEALATGGTAIIDDFDTAFHSMVLTEIIGWFYDPKRNPRNSQLWFSCQNASILEELSKDEVVFCEKDRRGRTQVYGLNDIKAVRCDENFYQNYIGGVYGAVPRIG